MPSPHFAVNVPFYCRRLNKNRKKKINKRKKMSIKKKKKVKSKKKKSQR